MSIPNTKVDPKDVQFKQVSLYLLVSNMIYINQ
jgi:hypothetical protein